MAKKKQKTTIKANKLNLWLRAYLDEGAATFLDKTKSARIAGYRCKTDDCFKSIGCQNFTKLHDIIAKWMDEYGLSESRLKEKMLSLMNAKEKKFFAKEGIVTDEREVEAIETQRKTLDMAIKVRGMYSPEKREHTGPGGVDLFANMLKDVNGATRELPNRNQGKIRE